MLTFLYRVVRESMMLLCMYLFRSKEKFYRRVPRSLQKIGVPAVKLGQLASTRFDMLPAALLHELGALRGSVNPVPYPYIAYALRSAYTQPLNEIFQQIDTEPLAVASIGQVHRATLVSGDEVVIKVRKPNVIKEVKAFMRVVKGVFFPFRIFSKVNRVYNLVLELESTLKDELDFRVEDNNALIVSKRLRSAKVPHIYREYTTSSTFVMEYIKGYTLDNVKYTSLDVKPQQLIELLFEQIFAGCFHADMHPGNILVDDKDLYLIDFGMVGRLVGVSRTNFIVLALGFIYNKEEIVTEAVLNLCYHRKQLDRGRLTLDIRVCMDRYTGVSLGDFDFIESLNHLLGVLKRHGLMIKQDMLYVIKALVTVEGVAVGMDKDITIQTMLQPFKVLLVFELSKDVIYRKLLKKLGELNN